MPEHIHTNIPFIFLLLILALAITASYLLYKYTLPPVGQSIRYLLGALRGVVIFLLIALLWAPQLSFTFREKQPMRVGIFTDNSHSMNYQARVKDKKENRWIKTLRAHETIQDLLPDHVQVEEYSFNINVHPMASEAIDSTTMGTDFNALLKFLNEQDYERIFIVSDGNHTHGAGYPLREEYAINGSVYTIGIGAPRKDKDVFIADLNYDRYIYKGKRSPLEVQIGSENVGRSTPAVVYLKQGNKVLATRKLDIEPGSPRQ
ncbi:MAG: hypothetical protein GF313_15190, partial [Caldithrix sp.]|nr:hypothetical protein [Caldithrix sp.]